jgi:molybdopterin-guanine dinucleotide biosynthesis protein A
MNQVEAGQVGWDVSWDALILTGGRAARLGHDKAGLVGPDGRTCLRRTVEACGGAGRRVVVGPDPGEDLPGVLVTREEPVFAGPAYAIRAGLARLGTIDGPGLAAGPGPAGGSPAAARGHWTMVLACDMPEVAQAVAVLLDRASRALTDVDGLVAASGGRRQWLCALYRSAALGRAAAALPPGGTGVAARALVAGLALAEVDLPAPATADIDTVAQMGALGFHPGGPPT